VSRLRAGPPTTPGHFPPRAATDRRPGLLDGMLFIAATAVGLALWRAYRSTVLPFASGNLGVRGLWYQSMGLSCLLGPWSLALLVASARQPRPRLRRLATRPAFVVGIAVLLVLVIEAVAVAAAMAIRGSESVLRRSDLPLVLLVLVPMQVGNTLAVAWAVQATRGRRRWRAGWLDRLGWAVGGGWIALALGWSVLQLLI